MSNFKDYAATLAGKTEVEVTMGATASTPLVGLPTVDEPEVPEADEEPEAEEEMQ